MTFQKLRAFPHPPCNAWRPTRIFRIGYQDIETLARYYDVSVDYLFDLTDLEQYHNVGIDKLWLSDEAIAVLKDGKLNNQLISELIAHADFP